MVGGVDVVKAEPREIPALRRETPGNASQVLRAVPRGPTRDDLAEPLRVAGTSRDEALQGAEQRLIRLDIPAPPCRLSPTTFFGGEQQHVTVARGFAQACPAMRLDEPAASLDAAKRDTVRHLIDVAKARGAVPVGISHDAAAPARGATGEGDASAVAPARAA